MMTRSLVTHVLSLGVAGVLLASASIAAHAQVFKCEVGGKTLYQQQPCEGASAAKQLVAKTPTQPNLWTELKTGMSIDEVKRLVPQSKTGKSNTLKNGARSVLMVAPVTVAGLDFEAEFFFLGDKFHRVNFSGPMDNDNAASRQAFDKLREIFRSRYGTPQQQDLKDAPSGLSGRADWRIDQGEVWMIVLATGPNTSLLNFGYLPKPL